MTKKFFITGTDTDIGKTFVTAGLAYSAVVSGMRTAVLKPVQTGTEDYPPDLCEIRRIVPGILDIPANLATPYSFSLPASPHLAAAEEGREIALSVMVDAVDKVEKDFSPDILLVEGAGGLLVPLNSSETMLDLMKEVSAPVIITASAGLGTINHTLMTVEILKNANIAIAGIIFNRMPVNPGVVEKDNISVIEKISGVPVLAVIEELPPGTHFADFSLPMLFRAAWENVIG